jgi:hypothetical protein
VEDWRRHAAAPVEDRSRRTSRSPQLESWTGGRAARARTLRAGVYAPLDWDNLSGLATRLPCVCSDWSEERDVGLSRLDWVEGGVDDGKPGQTGRHPRLAVTAV